MLAATNARMSGSDKKLNENNSEVSASFHVVVVQNIGNEMYKKSVLHVQCCYFAN